MANAPGGTAGAAVGGAATGAAAGSAGGPVGAGIGAGIGLIGGLISAIGGSTPEGLSAEALWALESGKLDINEFYANLAAAKLGQELPFQQAMTKWPVEFRSQIQKAYETGYGGLEASFVDFAEAALAGKETEYTKNMVARSNEQVGKKYDQGKIELQQQLASQGITPDSPAYAQAMLNLEKEKQYMMASTSRDIFIQQGEKALETGENMLRFGATSERLSGMEVPDAPLTAEEKAAQAQGEGQNLLAEADEWYQGRMKEIEGMSGPMQMAARMQAKMQYDMKKKAANAAGAKAPVLPTQVTPSESRTIPSVEPTNALRKQQADTRSPVEQLRDQYAASSDHKERARLQSEMHRLQNEKPYAS